MSDLSIHFDTNNDAWQFVDARGNTTNFSATSELQPFAAKDLSSRAANFDIAITGCTGASVEVVLSGPSVPLTWVASSGTDTLFAVRATCGTTSQSGYVKVKRSG